MMNPTADPMSHSSHPSRIPRALWSVVLLSAALSGCGGGGSSSTATTDDTLVVRIAHVAPTTGAIANIGLDSQYGAQLAVDDANARNLRIGGRPVRFELVARDDQGDPKIATQVAQELVQASVAGVIGHLNSGTSIPASGVYNAAGLVQITPSATNPKLTRQGYAGVFRMLADDVQLAGVLARYAVGNLHASRIVVVDDQTTYGSGMATSFAAAVATQGGSVISSLTLPAGSTAFDTVLASLQTAAPDLVFYGGLDAGAGSLLQQMRARGLTARVMGGDGICSGNLPALAGGTLSPTDVVCAEAGGVEAALLPALTAFKTRFQQRFGKDVQLYAPYAYDAVGVMVDAMVRAQSIVPASYLPQLRSSAYSGLSGTVSFDSLGDVRNGAVSLFSYQGTTRQSTAVIRATP